MEAGGATVDCRSNGTVHWAAFDGRMDPCLRRERLMMMMDVCAGKMLGKISQDCEQAIERGNADIKTCN